MAQVSARRPEASLSVCRKCRPEAMPPPNSFFFECCICGSVEEKPATRLPIFVDVVHDREEGRTTTTIPNDINDTQELEENATEQIPICRVATFIDDIEKAHNYFDLRDYLRAEEKFIEYRYSNEDVIDVLFGDPKAKDMLMNLSIQDIQFAVDAYLMEVRLKKISIAEHIRRFEESVIRKNGVTFLEEEHEQFGCMFPDFSPEALLKLDQYADSSPIFHLVLRTRETGRKLIDSRIRVAPTPFNGLQPPLKDIKTGGSNMYMKGKAEISQEIFTEAVSKYKHLCLYGEHVFSKKQQIVPEVCVLQEPLAALIFSESELRPLRPCTKRGNPLHEAPISD